MPFFLLRIITSLVFVAAAIHPLTALGQTRSTTGNPTSEPVSEMMAGYCYSAALAPSLALFSDVLREKRLGEDVDPMTIISMEEPTYSQISYYKGYPDHYKEVIHLIKGKGVTFVFDDGLKEIRLPTPRPIVLSGPASVHGYIFCEMDRENETLISAFGVRRNALAAEKNINARDEMRFKIQDQPRFNKIIGWPPSSAVDRR